MCELSRHGDVAAQYGGPNSWFAYFYAERWRKTADEYLALSEAGWKVSLWPYEDFPMHAGRDGFYGIARDWHPSPPRVRPMLDSETIDIIKTITNDVRRRLGFQPWI
ncbi:hypothetical protein [Herbidospora mongoliensis]|uniref:hypothetical protein n=1 Tax=Herbidospora mongoliensis TaxID=688067 RepID=UPI0012F8D2D2|nr:hypothetical protein [Herbidospora mongoliensis]